MCVCMLLSSGEGVIIADQIILDMAPLLIGISNSPPELTVELDTVGYTALTHYWCRLYWLQWSNYQTNATESAKFMVSPYLNIIIVLSQVGKFEYFQRFCPSLL